MTEDEYSKAIKTLKKQRQYAEAETLGMAAVAEFPDSAKIICGMADLYLKWGKLDLAEHGCAKAVNRFPNDAVARNGWAQTALVRGDFSAAEQRYAEAVQRFPDNAVARSGWAQTALVRGDLDAVEERCDAVLKIQPKNSIAKLLLCVVDVRRGAVAETPAPYYQSAFMRACGLLQCEFHPSTLRVLKTLAELGFQKDYYLRVLSAAVDQNKIARKDELNWLPDHTVAPENLPDLMTGHILGYACSKFFDDSARILRPVNGLAAVSTGWVYDENLGKRRPPAHFPK